MPASTNFGIWSSKNFMGQNGFSAAGRVKDACNERECSKGKSEGYENSEL
jgi:hypothetical protein